MTKKAMARGTPRKKKAVRRKKKATKKKEVQVAEMTIGEITYTVGDVGWFVDERSTLVNPRPMQGELTGVYPHDNIEPAVGIREYESGKHRAIRARLIGWTKKEAKENHQAFLKSQE